MRNRITRPSTAAPALVPAGEPTPAPRGQSDSTLRDLILSLASEIESLKKRLSALEAQRRG